MRPDSFSALASSGNFALGYWHPNHLHTRNRTPNSSALPSLALISTSCSRLLRTVGRERGAEPICSIWLVELKLQGKTKGPTAPHAENRLILPRRSQADEGGHEPMQLRLGVDKGTARSG
jgi:hypothetical protein